MDRPSIFICYRRVDAGWAGRLERELVERFGADAVFRDRTIPAAANWRTEIEDALGACKVMLVLIGPSWTQPTGPDGANRLWDSDDMVRHEIERGLQRADVPVMPVLCDDVAMPQPAQLPPGLQGLCDLQAVPLSDPRWSYDAAKLCKEVENFVRPLEPDDDGTLRPRVPAAVAAGMVAATSVAASLAWPLAQSLPGRPDPPDSDMFSSAWTQTVVERIASYTAERAVLWAVVGAIVLGALYAGLRELRGGAPAGLLLGLSTGALAGAIGGAAFIVLKDVGGVQSELLLNGIGVAVAGAVFASRFDAFVERSTLRTAGLGGGLVAGALGALLFGHDAMLAFTTQAVVLTGILAAALAAPSIAPRPLRAGQVAEL